MLLPQLQNGPLSSMSSTDSESTSRSDAVGLAVLAGMSFLPMIGNGNVYRLMLMIALVIWQMAQGRYRLQPEIKRLLCLMVLSSIVPLMAVMLLEGSVNFAFWSHEFIRILFYCLLIPVVYNYRTSSEYMFRLCLVVLMVNFGIQFMQWRGLGNINGWIYEHYAPKDKKFTHLMLAMQKGAGFRAGSIFLNPNVCMVIPCTVLSVLLQRNIHKPSPINYIWIAFVVFSVLLTGSRTAFVLTMASVGYCTWKDKNAGKIKWLLPLILVSGLWMNANHLEDARAVDLDTAMAGSGYMKINGILAYLQYADFLYLLTGCCGSSKVFGLDSEWGYIYMFYGILGIMWYLSFLKLFQRNRVVLFSQTLGVTIVICLIACTASVFLCMPVCSFFCMVALPKYSQSA